LLRPPPCEHAHLLHPFSGRFCPCTSVYEICNLFFVTCMSPASQPEHGNGSVPSSSTSSSSTSPAPSPALPLRLRPHQGEQHPLSSPLHASTSLHRRMEKRSETVLKTKTKKFQFRLFHGPVFRRRSSPVQAIPAGVSSFPRCTTSPAIYWSLNRPKRCSIGVAIVFQSWLRK
jgi:hypothetical protein